MRAGIRDSGFGIGQGKSSRRRLGAVQRGRAFFESRISNLESRRHAKGFTLLEVIAAIMLLAIAFTALMRVAGGSIRLSQNASNHSEAALWARSLLDTAFTTEAIQPGITSGRFDQRFRWQLVVTPWHPPSAPPNMPLQLYQLDLDVMWGASVHPYSAHFRTLRLAAAAPAADNGQSLR